MGSLADIAYWARGSGLEIVLLVLGSVLLTRLAAWVRGLMIGHVEAHDDSTDSLVRSEEAKHRHALIQVLTWVVLVMVYCVAAVLVVARLGIPLTGLVAPATIVGVAFGLGGQRIVQDVLAGFFIIAERQYGFGDLVRVSTAGVVGDATGTVEDVNLRVTRLRSVDGEVIVVPNGQISRTVNLSRDWARAVIDVPIPATVGVGRATEILQLVGAAAWGDDELRVLLLDAPTVMGVETIEVDEFRIRMVARTLPGKQFSVGRELRTRVAVAFRKEGMTVPAELDTAQSTGELRVTRRVRLSTVVLTVVFAGVLALYVQVRPPPVAVTVTGTGTVETSVVPTPAPLRTVPLTKEPTAVTTSAPAPTTSAVPEVAPPSDRARPRSTSETSPPPTSGSAP